MTKEELFKKPASEVLRYANQMVRLNKWTMEQMLRVIRAKIKHDRLTK